MSKTRCTTYFDQEDIRIFISIIVYGDKLVAKWNFDHRGYFSSSIDWQCQKQRKRCATRSKVKDPIKFNELS